MTFYPTIVIDNETDKTVHINWPEYKKINSMVPPEIKGYVPSPKYIDSIKVTRNSEMIKEVVEYSIKSETTLIEYFDSITKNIIYKEKVPQNQKNIDSIIKARIQFWENRGYKLKDNSLNNTSEKYIVFFEHKNTIFDAKILGL